MNADIAISIVLYKPKKVLIIRTITSLINSLNYAKKRKIIKNAIIILINNETSERSIRFTKYLQNMINSNIKFPNVKSISGHGNIGFGKGHNLSILREKAEFYLILNPDVEIDEDALSIGIEYLQKNINTGLVVPQVVNLKKKHLCKKYPSISVLFLRSFAPNKVKQKYKSLIEEYELYDLDTDSVQKAITIASGCFMLYRGKVIKEISGFDPRYFLYMEDFDICIRTKKISNIVFLPKMKISHFGGYAYKKGIKDIILFIKSTFTFFNSHGWKYI